MPNYVRIVGAKFRLEDNNGNPAAGFYLYTYAAGTSTLATSYFDRDCAAGHENTNPIILDVRGECDLYTNVALKLIAKDTDGNQIWSEDYQGEQQTAVSDKFNGSRDDYNLYTGATVPAYTSIDAGFSLEMIPDKTNLDTLQVITGVSPYFGGTGINDLTWSGPYTGTTANSIFRIEILNPFVLPPLATTIAENLALGSVTAGVHLVKLSAVTADGESGIGEASNAVTAAGARKIDVTGIPAIAGAVTGYKVCMTKAGGAVYYEVATVVATTYTINVADASLTTLAATTNTTGDGVSADLTRWKKDGGIWHQLAITASPTTPQTLQEDVAVTFGEKTGHTKSDYWTQTVMTPAMLNFCSLGSDIIYKNVAGVLKALSGGDIVANIPANIVRASGSYILNNPSLPQLTYIARKIYRRTVTANDTVTAADSGNEISFAGIAARTQTLLACSTANGLVFDFVNATNYDWTIQTDPTATLDLIVTPENPTGVTSFVLGPGQRKACRLVSDGVSYHMESDAGYVKDSVKYTFYPTAGTYTWTKTTGYNKAYALVIGGGAAGGASGTPGAGGGGGSGGIGIKSGIDITSVTTVTVTVGGPAGTSSFGAYVSATGGTVGTNATGIPGDGGTGVGGDINIKGGPGSFGHVGSFSGNGGSNAYAGGALGTLSDPAAGANGTAPGGGGSGAFSTGVNEAGGLGSDGLVMVMEYR